MAEPMPRGREPLPLTLAVPSGRTIVRQGEASAGLWTVESGALTVGVVAPDGHALMLDVLGPGDAVGEPDGGISLVSVRALRPCRLRPAQADTAMRLLATRAQRVAALACELAWLDVAGRVERRLDDLAQRFGRPAPGGTRIIIALSQDDLASLAGTSRESTNRALRALRRAGRLHVEARGRYVMSYVPDPSCKMTRLHELQ
jgi:CRP/FNR family cyclic AMP-dependent transcriptional regulator